MLSWLVTHQAFLLIALAVSLVVLPLVLGVALGHIPKEVFLGSALPLAIGTFLLAIGIYVGSNYLDPIAKFVISLLFGLIWIGAGIQMIRIEKQSDSGPPEAAQARRGISYTFLIFGAIWVTVTIIRFLRPKIGL